MAIKLPDPGNGIPEQKTGNDEWTNMKIVRDNFADQSNAASRLVGNNAGNLLEVGAHGLGSVSTMIDDNVYVSTLRNGFYTNGSKGIISYGQQWTTGFRALLELPTDYDSRSLSQIRVFNGGEWTNKRMNDPAMAAATITIKIYTDQNTIKDSNGFLKAASPVVDLYDDHLELNHDAERQGGITFEKLGTGNYLIKGSLGFAQEGWYIEMPKDANGNVLVAVAYEQLDNNDISIKTYDYMLNKKGRIVPDIETPLDIPEGRCINLRLHEVKEQLDEPTI